MKTSMLDIVRRIDELFAEHVRNGVDMNKKVEITFQTALVASVLVDVVHPELTGFLREIQDQFRNGTHIPNRGNAIEMLKKGSPIAHTIGTNCRKTLTGLINAERPSNK